MSNLAAHYRRIYETAERQLEQAVVSAAKHQRTEARLHLRKAAEVLALELAKDENENGMVALEPHPVSIDSNVTPTLRLCSKIGSDSTAGTTPADDGSRAA